jgi:hypothetical protein
MRRFLVDRASIENVVQPEAVEAEEPPPNVANEFNPNEIIRDPGRRKQINEYAPDIQDQVRRAYILKGPMQPDLATFPRTQFGSGTRAFVKSWYQKYTWIEYSEFKDAAYCFHCFLFKIPGKREHFGYEVFTKDGFKDWKHATKGFTDHVGSHRSMHNSCMKDYDDYNNQRQSGASKFARATRESEELYKICLTCSVDCAPQNCVMLCGDIQKEHAESCAHEVTKVIMKELGDRQFSMLIDESRDISVKEQMAVMLRLVVVYIQFVINIILYIPSCNLVEFVF